MLQVRAGHHGIAFQELLPLLGPDFHGGRGVFVMAQDTPLAQENRLAFKCVAGGLLGSGIVSRHPANEVVPFMGDYDETHVCVR